MIIRTFLEIKNYQIENVIQNAIQNAIKNELTSARDRRPPITRTSQNTFEFKWSSYNYPVTITFFPEWEQIYRANNTENISYTFTIQNQSGKSILLREEITYFEPKIGKNILIISLNSADGLAIPENNGLIYDVGDLINKLVDASHGRGGKKDKKDKKSKRSKRSKKSKRSKRSKRNKTTKNMKHKKSNIQRTKKHKKNKQKRKTQKK